MRSERQRQVVRYDQICSDVRETDDGQENANEIGSRYTGLVELGDRLGAGKDMSDGVGAVFGGMVRL